MCVFQNFPQIFPLGGDTPFYAFGYEIKDFYLTRKKTVAATDGVCVSIHPYSTQTLVLSVTSGSVNPDAHFVSSPTTLLF